MDFDLLLKICRGYSPQQKPTATCTVLIINRWELIHIQTCLRTMQHKIQANLLCEDVKKFRPCFIVYILLPCLLFGHPPTLDENAGL